MRKTLARAFSPIFFRPLAITLIVVGEVALLLGLYYVYGPRTLGKQLRLLHEHGLATLVPILLGAPMAFALWVWRNRDKQEDLANAHQAHGLQDGLRTQTDLHRLTEWATDAQEPALRLLAISRLATYLNRDGPTRSQVVSTFVAMYGAWLQHEETRWKADAENADRYFEPDPPPQHIRLLSRMLRERDTKDGVAYQHSDLRFANLVGIDWSKTDLRRANLQNAKLDQADMTGAQLQNSYLAFASLRGADLSYADLSGANLSGAALGNAEFHQTQIEGVVFSAAARSYVESFDVIGKPTWV